MTSIQYDGSFEGFLTAIFEVYEYKFEDPRLTANRGAISLFGKQHVVNNSPEKAERVLKKLRLELSVSVCKKIYEVHLSEQEEIANVLLRFVQYGLKAGRAACDNFSHEAVLKLHQTLKKVHRERHRMEAFIRFQRSEDDLYFALVAPDYDVLPLISTHFAKRYADQRWLIYDTKRNYGLLYDLQQVHEVAQLAVSSTGMQTGPAIGLHAEEEKFQSLWKEYFKSVNIRERKNTALHLRHMPRRYWRYLIEKQYG